MRGVGPALWCRTSTVTSSSAGRPARWRATPSSRAGPTLTGIPRVQLARDRQQPPLAEHLPRGVARLGQGVGVDDDQVPPAERDRELLVGRLIIDPQRQVGPALLRGADRPGRSSLTFMLPRSSLFPSRRPVESHAGVVAIEQPPTPPTPGPNRLHVERGGV